MSSENGNGKNEVATSNNEPLKLNAVDELINKNSKQENASTYARLVEKLKKGRDFYGHVSSCSAIVIIIIDICWIVRSTPPFKVIISSVKDIYSLYAVITFCVLHIGSACVLAYLAYTFLQMAERFYLPLYIEDPVILQTLLGVKTPWSLIDGIKTMIYKKFLGEQPSGEEK